MTEVKTAEDLREKIHEDVVQKWQGYWMRETDYSIRAISVDANMRHHLSDLIYNFCKEHADQCQSEGYRKGVGAAAEFLRNANWKPPMCMHHAESKDLTPWGVADEIVKALIPENDGGGK